MSSLTDLLFSEDEDDHLLLMKRLRTIVRGELHERNLFHAPPGRLGYSGPTWVDNDTLADLVGDAYEFNFRRRAALDAQRRHKKNVDGLIRLNVKHFITDQQAKFDPLGFSVYQNAIGGIERAVESKVLRTDAAEAQLDGHTLLKYGTWNQHSAPADAARMRDALLSQRGVGDLKELATICQDAQIQIEVRITRLPQSDSSIEGFHCRDLVEPLKIEVRAAHHAGAVVGAGTVVQQPDEDATDYVQVSQAEDPGLLVVRALGRTVDAANLPATMKTHLKNLIDDLDQHPESTSAERARRLAVPPQRMSEWMSLLGQLLGGAQ